VRISTHSKFRIPLLAIQENTSSLADLQTRMALSRRVLTPSDDPVAVTPILRSRQNVRIAETGLDKILSARSFLETQEAHLDLMTDIMDKVSTLIYRGAQDGLGADSRNALAVEVDAYLVELADLLNTEWNGIQLFGGKASRTAPVNLGRNEEGVIDSASVAAPDVAPRSFYFGTGQELTLGITAADVLGKDGEAFQDIIALRDSLRADDGDGIRAFIDIFQEHLSEFQTQQAVVGVQVNRLFDLETTLDTKQVEAESIRSRYEDLDMTAASMRMQEQTAVLEATLTASARIFDLSLLDFLR
jgi:flagellar hook-associated protein 3 FlgL